MPRVRPCKLHASFVVATAADTVRVACSLQGEWRSDATWTTGFINRIQPTQNVSLTTLAKHGPQNAQLLATARHTSKAARPTKPQWRSVSLSHHSLHLLKPQSLRTCPRPSSRPPHHSMWSLPSHQYLLLPTSSSMLPLSSHLGTLCLPLHRKQHWLLWISLLP